MPHRTLIMPVVPASACKVGANIGANNNDLRAGGWLDIAQTMKLSVLRSNSGMGWQNVENYTTGVITLPGRISNFITGTRDRGIDAMLTAAYGPPRVTLQDFTVTTAIAAATPGDTSVLTTSVEIQTLDGSAVPAFIKYRDYIAPVAGSGGNPQAYFTRKGAKGYGAMIDSYTVNPGDPTKATLILPSATKNAVAAGQRVRVTRMAYPAITGSNPALSQTQAYLRYATQLAYWIADLNHRGWVCLWNEPTWSADKWNDSRGFIEVAADGGGGDVDPGEGDQDDGDAGRLTGILLAALTGPPLPDGVRFINGASDKTGLSAMLNNVDLAAQITPQRILDTVRADGWHPYGPIPETAMWNPRDLDVSGKYTYVNDTDSGNWRGAGLAQDNYAAANGGVAPLRIATECGAKITDDTIHARFIVRRVVSLWAISILPLIYSLDDSSDWALAREVDGFPVARQSGQAIQRLNTRIANLGTPDRHGAVIVPNQVGWQHNSLESRMFSVAMWGAGKAACIVWLHNQYQPDYRTANYTDDVRPNPKVAQLFAPANANVTEIIDLVTGDLVAFERTGNLVSMTVRDNPIMMSVQKAG